MENVATQSRFRGEILTKVYRVWLTRRLMPVLLAEILGFSLVLYWLGQTVFVQQILQNALNVLFTNPKGIFAFFASAFSNAAIATKFLTIALAVFFALVVRHLTQGALRFILVRQNFFSRIDEKK